MKVSVKNLSNEVVKEIEVSDAIFGYPYKEHLIHIVVEACRADQRRGTHKVKGRGEVRGSNRKPWRQKGTGRARVGEARSPLWRGGGTVHGPVLRSHSKKVSVKEKKNALRSALSQKLREEGIVVIDSLELETHKTQTLAQQIQGLGLSGRALVVDSMDNRNLVLAARNNPQLEAVDALAVNVYDVVGRQVILSEDALGRLVEVLSR